VFVGQDELSGVGGEEPGVVAAVLLGEAEGVEGAEPFTDGGPAIAGDGGQVQHSQGMQGGLEQQGHDDRQRTAFEGLELQRGFHESSVVDLTGVA
jgi:hypothetical protein